MIGPVERRLSLFGDVLPLVVGAFGEHNAYFDQLLRAAALARSERHWRRMRCTSQEHCRSLLMAMLRRTMGLAAVRANAQLVFRRLGHEGAGGGPRAMLEGGEVIMLMAVGQHTDCPRRRAPEAAPTAC